MFHMKSKRILCCIYGCDKEAVGEARGGIFKKWRPHCKEHLKVLQKAGLSTRLFKDSQISFCPYCDAQLKHEAIYCSHCGKKIR